MGVGAYEVISPEGKDKKKGEAYEEIVGPNLRGDRGEFFTPREVVEFMVKLHCICESMLSVTVKLNGGSSQVTFQKNSSDIPKLAS